MIFEPSPDLIPHESFHRCHWFLPLRRPEWYYFIPNDSHGNTWNSSILNSVDKPLQPLVQLLQSHGFHTTPSCSGHNFPESHLSLIYNHLLKDSLEIRGPGLLFENIETGEHLEFQNDYYKMPWDRETFIEKLKSYQHKGVLGIKTGNDLLFKYRLLSLKIPFLQTSDHDDIVLLIVKNPNGTNITTWNQITAAIRQLMNVLHYI